MTTLDAGLGRPPTPDEERLIELRNSLTMAETLARVNANARATVGTVATVGTLLSALGVISAQTLLSSGAARTFALGAVACSVAAVIVAVLYLALRLQRVEVRRLEKLRRWYDGQLRRARLAVAASWLLVIAVVLAAVAGTIGVVEAGSPDSTTLGLTIAGSADSRRLDVAVEVAALPTGSAVDVEVDAVATDACAAAVLLRGTHRVDRPGKVAISTSISPLPCNERFTLTVSGDHVDTRSLTVP